MTAPLHCLAHGVADRFQWESLREFLDAHYPLVAYRDVFHVAKDEWDAFIFSYGVVVTWGMPFDASKQLLDELSAHEIAPLDPPFYDDFTYLTEGERFRIHLDTIELVTADPMEKLSVSHGLAQSIKLGQFERQVDQTIDETHYIPERIARHGRTRLSGRELARMRGRLYLTRSGINLRFDLLDTPEFFWKYPGWQETYAQTCSYLEVAQRLEVLNARLTVIHELFEMLTAEHQHRHSSRLEWIIIWLIAFEIAIFLVHDILKLV